MAECDDARAVGHQRAKTIQIDSSVRRQLADEELRATLDGELLPGDEIGVMLERGDNDLVVASDIRSSPRRCNEVDGLGGAAREDQAIAVGDSEEFRDSVSRALIAIGCCNRQRIRAAMGICVARLVELAYCIENDLRLLRCGR